jgi:hypothetical protein
MFSLDRNSGPATTKLISQQSETRSKQKIGHLRKSRLRRPPILSRRLVGSWLGTDSVETVREEGGKKSQEEEGKGPSNTRSGGRREKAKVEDKLACIHTLFTLAVYCTRAFCFQTVFRGGDGPAAAYWLQVPRGA